jgi:hypothetical protein
MKEPQTNRLTLVDLEQLTLEYGGNWGLAHVHRLLKLIEQIGGGLEHDAQALTWAVYLHDWGAFPKYAQSGVEHALRSRQVAESEILPRSGLPPAARALILERIGGTSGHRSPRIPDYDQSPGDSALRRP